MRGWPAVELYKKAMGESVERMPNTEPIEILLVEDSPVTRGWRRRR